MEEKTWIKIKRYKRGSGWTRKDLLSKSKPQEQTLYNTAASLNVRARPEPNAEIVAQLVLGEMVRVSVGSETIGDEYTWVHIGQGWVVKDYLSEDRPLSEKEKLAGKMPRQSGWDGSYREVGQYLKRVMHDPSSLEWEGCTKVFWDKSRRGYLVGCTYRGNNAFGARIKNANWFVIRHGEVVEVLDEDAYQWN